MTPPHSKPTKVKTHSFPYRVIDTYSFEFNENPGDVAWEDGYATLSHTWIYEKGDPVEIIYEGAKTLFKDLNMGKKLPSKRDPGTSKLLYAILAARDRNHRFLWLDTCCIKETEKEISIPSMGNWYMNANICLVFLEDLYLSESDISFGGPGWANFKRPRWSTRGWTIQEIVLSRRAIFFNVFWDQVFDFDPKNYTPIEVLQRIEKLCGMVEQVICSGAKGDVPWQYVLGLADGRNVTKPEDKFNCIAGLSNVELRPRKGEGLMEVFERHLKQENHPNPRAALWESLIALKDSKIEPGSRYYG